MNWEYDEDANPAPVGGEVLADPVTNPWRTTRNTGVDLHTSRPERTYPEPEPVDEHGPARIVALCNQKGGVGKTTTTINLGAAIAEYGRRVLLVDFDPQGALSVGLGRLDPRELDLTV